MKLSSLPLFAAVVVLASCNQSAPATEQPAAAPVAKVPPTEAPGAAVPATNAQPAEAAPEAEAPAPAAAGTETVKLSLRFKQAPGPEGPEGHKSSAHLLMQGKKAQDIDLGQFAGKPDLVDAAEAKRAGFPSGMLVGFRSYDPGSGTSSDLAVMNVGGRLLRIVQRRIQENADKAPEFQTAREIPLPANALVEVAPSAKK